MQSERVCETMFFKHKYVTNPTVIHADMVVKAFQDLYTLFQKKKNSKDDETMQGLKEIINILLEIVQKEKTTIWEESIAPVSIEVVLSKPLWVSSMVKPPQVPITPIPSISPPASPSSYHPMPPARVNLPSSPTSLQHQ